MDNSLENLSACITDKNLNNSNILDLKTFREPNVLNTELIQHYQVLPLNKLDNLLYLAISDATDQSTLDAVAFHTGLKILPMVFDAKNLNNMIEKYCHEISNHSKIEDFLLDEVNIESSSANIKEPVVNYDEPLIKLVDHIIQLAVQRQASDIHIEQYTNFCRIRFRRDGLLSEMMHIKPELANRFITRLKVMAKLDITERRLPQDGRFTLHHIDIRLNTCPTLFGEKVVLRLLNGASINLDIDLLGLTDEQKKLFIKKITCSQGLILVAGPTGSGKTQTLYSALNYLNRIEKNISTVEDPVEIQLPGINQININPKIGLDFTSVLRTLLRQDPDIMMVGEIRDKQTAEIAIQAAHTGHLVFSTVHTNNAYETIARLISMGIPPYNLAHSISLVIAQRLVRKLCPCKTIDTSESGEFTIYKAVGCEHCLLGYKGRTGIYEFLPFTEKISDFILQNKKTPYANKSTKSASYFLYQAGLEKVREGITTIYELERVLQT